MLFRSPAWGAPPPVPAHAHDRPPVHPLFVPSASDLAGPAAGGGEGELNLADLINIDEDPSGEVAMTPVDVPPSPFGESPAPLAGATEAPKAAKPVPSGPSPAGLSPFAAPGLPSFDLNALWQPTGDEPAAEPKPDQDQEHEGQATTEPMDEDKQLGTELEGVSEEAEDRDFDMLLGDNDQDQDAKTEPEPKELTPEEKRAAFDAEAPVWSGTVSIPSCRFFFVLTWCFS